MPSCTGRNGQAGRGDIPATVSLVRADGSLPEKMAMMMIDFYGMVCSGDVCCNPAKDTACGVGQGADGCTGAGGAGQIDGLLLPSSAFLS